VRAPVSNRAGAPLTREEGRVTDQRHAQLARRQTVTITQRRRQYLYMLLSLRDFLTEYPI